MRIGVVDYKAGNLTSVVSALNFLKADYFVSDNPQELMDADKIIFPGVGEASYAMNILKNAKLDVMLSDFIASGRKVLGICLGAQIVFSFSEENETKCLGFVEGRVEKFPDIKGFKIPHMGWNNVKYSEGSKLFSNIPQNSSFYFVHSYYMKPLNSADTSGLTDYCMEFTSAVERENIFAVQFHPEKSGTVGLKLLENFINMER
ncbi:MAG: imidazole glycerol phosphate synthase subunit HisH [Spirochaetales bacterium]|nr:imidazole glycerol phosphate synthase subunit HisH [Spirochaetales bacterium]